MLSIGDLKNLLHQASIKQQEQLLLLLFYFDRACQISDLRKLGGQAGLKITTKSNPSRTLGRSNGLAIRTTEGWEITEAGKQHLRARFPSLSSSKTAPVQSEFRQQLTSINDQSIKDFLEEAIECFEYNLLRAAVVMSWIAAIAVLQEHVVNTSLAKFNAEATRLNQKWKPAATAEDLGRMREADFLDVLVTLGILTKSVKTDLRSCLDRRNSCSHPTTLRIGENTVTHHIETLILNVFSKFS